MPLVLQGPFHFLPVTHQPRTVRRLHLSGTRSGFHIDVGSVEVFDVVLGKDIQNFLFGIFGLGFGIAAGIFVNVSQSRSSKDDFDILRHVEGCLYKAVERTG